MQLAKPDPRCFGKCGNTRPSFFRRAMHGKNMLAPFDYSRRALPRRQSRDRVQRRQPRGAGYHEIKRNQNQPRGSVYFFAMKER